MPHRPGSESASKALELPGQERLSSPGVSASVASVGIGVVEYCPRIYFRTRSGRSEPSPCPLVAA